MKKDLRPKMVYKRGDKVKVTGPVNSPLESWGGVPWLSEMNQYIGRVLYISRRMDLSCSYDCYSLSPGNCLDPTSAQASLKPLMSPGKEVSTNPHDILAFVPHWLEPVDFREPEPERPTNAEFFKKIPLDRLDPRLIEVKQEALRLVQQTIRLTKALDKLSKDLKEETTDVTGSPYDLEQLAQDFANFEGKGGGD